MPVLRDQNTYVNVFGPNRILERVFVNLVKCVVTCVHVYGVCPYFAGF